MRSPAVVALRAVLCAVLGALLVAACAGWQPPPPGSDQASLIARWGPPSARHALADGAQRLEYSSGPRGRETWMVDVDAGGRVLVARQVLTESELLAVMARTDLDAAALLRWIGQPSERRHGGRMGGEVWSWRYLTNDCLWFQSSIAADGRVTGSGFAIDPACDVRVPSD